MPSLDVMVPEDIGEDDECVVVTWLKREGDFVEKGEDLLILQVAKVSYDVPARASGKLAAILVQPGEIVKHDQPLARLEVSVAEAGHPLEQAEQGTTPTEKAQPASGVHASPVAKRLAREHGVDLAQVSGTGREGRITEKDVLAFLATQSATETATWPAEHEVHASPIARRLAREHRVDLAQVRGTGYDGRITQKDVSAFIAGQQAAPTTSRTGAPPAPAEKSVPFTGMRATIARRMQDSLQSMAQLTLFTEADVGELVVLRDRLKQDMPVTYTDLLVCACALALRQHPRLNATLEGQTIRLLPHINIGVAVALDEGLIVPVIPDADRKNLAVLAELRGQLAAKARAGQLTASEISDGTFTITNLGTYDVDGFTPIINPPEVAILGVGRIVEKVAIHQGKVAQRYMMTLSLTFDHRAVDGAPAAAFLQSVKRLLEAPEELL